MNMIQIAYPRSRREYIDVYGDFETMISIYNKSIIQRDHNIKFTSIFQYTFNILNKRIKDCKNNIKNFLCEKNEYTYRVVKLIPYKYQGIK